MHAIFTLGFMEKITKVQKSDTNAFQVPLKSSKRHQRRLIADRFSTIFSMLDQM